MSLQSGCIFLTVIIRPILFSPLPLSSKLYALGYSPPANKQTCADLVALGRSQANVKEHLQGDDVLPAYSVHCSNISRNFFKNEIESVLTHESECSGLVSLVRNTIKDHTNAAK